MASSAFSFTYRRWEPLDLSVSSGFRRDVLNGTVQTMWNRDDADPFDENMSVLFISAPSLRLMLRCLVTPRIPSISNIAGSHPPTGSSLTASSSPGARYPFFLLFFLSLIVSSRAQRCGVGHNPRITAVLESVFDSVPYYRRRARFVLLLRPGPEECR